MKKITRSSLATANTEYLIVDVALILIFCAGHLPVTESLTIPPSLVMLQPFPQPLVFLRTENYIHHNEALCCLLAVGHGMMNAVRWFCNIEMPRLLQVLHSAVIAFV